MELELDELFELEFDELLELEFEELFELELDELLPANSKGLDSTVLPTTIAAVDAGVLGVSRMLLMPPVSCGVTAACAAAVAPVMAASAKVSAVPIL